jgi:subtilisin family serine protease
MKRAALAALMSAALCACATHAVRIAPSTLVMQPSQSPDRFIIAAVANEPVAFVASAGGAPQGYKGGAVYGPTSSARELLRSLEVEYGLREVKAWPIEPLHLHCAVLGIPDGVDREALLTRLSHDPRIKLAQPLQTFATRTEEYNDPYVALQHGFQEMRVADAHRWSRGDSVKVAIIDTGADTTHPDLGSNIVAAANFVDDDAAQFRRDRHGTEMAGVIGAVANNREGIVGVAPGARLLVFKACWQLNAGADAAKCNSFTLAQALVAALDAHAQVVNLSLVGPPDPLLRDLIREGLRRGILFVGAAADAAGGGATLMHEPGVIEVASSGSRSAGADVLYAPGREILTLLPGGHYDFATGDSIATAQVSGVLALLLGKNQSLSPAAAYRLLRETMVHSSADDSSPQYVDACAAMVALGAVGECPSNGSAQHMVAGY